MRGSKKRGVTAPPSEMVDDAGVDVAMRKGVRCCVECGATSTPQWREGPMGPKTLCNACGVRRQRLIRKQQAAQAASPVIAAIPAAQRRLAGRHLQGSDTPEHGVGSVSEQYSDETDQYGEWAAHAHAPDPQQHADASCNEEESAARDLLFFASSLPADAEDAGGAWRSHVHGARAHNTRRQMAPQRRSDDFYYYHEDEPEPELGYGAGGDGASKRRRMPPPRTAPSRALPGSSMSSSEEPVEGPAPLASAMSYPGSPAPASWTPQRNATASQLQDLLACEQPLSLQPLASPQPLASLSPLRAAAAARGVLGADAPSLTSHSSAPVLPLSVPHAVRLPLPLPRLELPLHVAPLALPLPLSLHLPSSISPKDLEVLAQIHADFQESRRQLQRAEAACEAVGAVVAEQRQAAARAHELAASATQQLAAEARSVAERYGVRDLLMELRGANAAAAAAAAAGGLVAPAAAVAAGGDGGLAR